MESTPIPKLKRQFWPVGIRQKIYAYLKPLELHQKASKLSKMERGMIPNTEIVDQKRDMKQS